MPKISRTLDEKTRDFHSQFPDEFTINSVGDFQCVLCFCVVKANKISNVKSHRNGKKHQRRLRQRDAQSATLEPESSTTNTYSWASVTETSVSTPTSDVFTAINSSDSLLDDSPTSSLPVSTGTQQAINENYSASRPLSERVSRAFLAADIPLKKLRNVHIQQLFLSMNNPPPAESTCRRKAVTLAKEVRLKVKNIVEKTKVGIFVVFDESTMDGVSYASTLVGTVENPTVTYLVGIKELEKPLNAQITSQLIDNQLRKFDIEREKVLLLISDAATYMIRAGEMLKGFYGKLTHVTCTSHLLHNACMKIKSSFPEVDMLIASVKAATRKNRTRREMFRIEEIPIPPAPVITRWGSWLKAASYYAKYFHKVEHIFGQISGGKLVEKAQTALRDPNVFSSLTVISRQYSEIMSIFDKQIDVNFSIQKAFKLINDLDFEEDSFRIKEYILRRLKKNGLTKIVQQEIPDLSPSDYAFLQKCQSTSISVERSFSILKKINAPDRNFKRGNIEEYLLCKFNAHIL